MNRKQAHQRKNIKSNWYKRHRIEKWQEDYIQEQLDWLFKNGHIQMSDPMVRLGERETDQYIQFTNEGCKWYDWYQCGPLDYFLVFIIKKYWWRRKWQALRIKLGHRYPWQDYDYYCDICM